MTLIVSPVNIIFLTRVYYELREDREGYVEDTLLLMHNPKLNKLEAGLYRFFEGKKGLTLSVVIAFVVAFGFLDSAITQGVIHLGRDLNIAGHKGDGVDAPENSIAGIMSALEKGANFDEIDVQQSKDGVLVLCHDKSLKNVAGLSSHVMDLTYEELSNVDIGKSFSDDYIGEKIPSLEEALAAAKDKIGLIIDLKTYGGNGVHLAREIVRFIEKYDMVEDCYVQSLDSTVLKAIKEENEDIKIG